VPQARPLWNLPLPFPTYDIQGFASALASLLPALVAASQQGLGSPGVAVACLPIVVPFQVPMVSEDAWSVNKRARAFHRCCVIGVCAQGIFAVTKLASGNFIGAVYDAIQACMGAYAVMPGGVRFFPTYISVSGFNGMLGVLQIFQSYNGLPLQLIPKMAILPPVIALSSAYWGWQFCREVRAIAIGLPNFGPQDTCFVKCMGSDWWLPSSLSAAASDSRSESNDADGEVERIHAGGFASYAGSGHRLGDFDADKPE